MSDLRKAAEMALEALEMFCEHGAILRPLETKETLRQALAQPEQEQKTPLKVLNLTVFTENRLRNGRVYDVETLQAMTNRDILAIPDMGKKALKEVMEALDVYAVNMSQERVDETAKGEHEPVAWMHNFIEGTVITHEPADIDRHPDRWTPLYTAPPKREWVGLTDEEIDAAVKSCNTLDTYKYFRAIEAKLKDKNSG